MMVNIPMFDVEAPASVLVAGPRLGYRVVGIDVSLSGTGVATPGGTARIPTTGRRRDSILERHRRLQHITGRVLEEVGVVDLACVEGPSHHSVGGSVWDRGGLWWRIVGGLVAREIPVAVIPPTSRAKYATGSGAARKAAVLEAAQRRYGSILASDDEADALVLRAMGMDWLEHPIAEVPAGHRAALAGCQWPERETVTR
jgi:Holliday junction resolvasome RuvABC endonuclease subunit